MAKSVRVALVGPGAWGKVLAKAGAQSAKLEFVACVGRSPDKLAAFSRETGMPARSFEDVLADKDVDAVILTLPNDLHYEFTRRAAEAGKHVYVEKPIAATMAEGVKVIDVERRTGMRIVVGHCARLLAGNRLIRKAIDDGTLGRITQIEATFANDRAMRLHDKDWRFYQQGAPGGPLSQIAVHQFDTVRYLGGDIASVSAQAARHAPVGAEVEDQWIVSLRFADGKLGTVLSSWTGPGVHSVRVTGFDAQMFYDIDQTSWGNAERLHENATLYIQPRTGGPAARRMLEVPPGNMFRDELELFADAVASGGDCELSAANGLQALAAVYAAMQSAEQQGRSVALGDVIEEAKANNKARGDAS
jgi:predicted dehydrogenase